jgi:sterol desaturase/sphingolipid hydroxylase (fatty acid hydroxylase superfamily)
MENPFPTPLEILMDPVSLAIIAMYAALMIWEAVAPAKQLPEIRGWKLRGLVSFAVFFYLSSYLPMVTDGYLAQYQLLDLTGLGTWGGAAAGILIFEFGVYVWHRALHASDILWRGFHQMHHSAERLDTFGAFYFSPADMVGWTVLGSISLVLVIGITPEAATIVLLTTTLMAMFTHTNVRTPRWLGYIIERPESHSVHHARGAHRNNYSELPLFDMLFGTFVNPGSCVEETGFYPGASARVVDMVLFRDVAAAQREGERGTRGEGIYVQQG